MSKEESENELEDWSEPPSGFVPNQKHWCYGCDNYDGDANIPMTKDYPKACKTCSFLGLNGED